MKAQTAIIIHYGTMGSLLYLHQLAAAFKNKGYPAIFYLPKKKDIGIKNNSLCRYGLKEPSENPAFLKPKFLKYPYYLSKYLYNALIIRPEGSVKAAHLLSLFYLTDLLILQTYRKALEK